jgi:hypothetical protein
VALRLGHVSLNDILKLRLKNVWTAQDRRDGAAEQLLRSDLIRQDLGWTALDFCPAFSDKDI